MFRTINSKFYAIAILLTISFGLSYSILAYFQQQQSISATIARDAIILERDISTLTEFFYEVRVWERIILSENIPEADIRFSTLIEKIRNSLSQLSTSNIDSKTNNTLKQVVEAINTYEAGISQLVQMKTRQSLQETRMETSYRSMVSIVLSSNNTYLFKPLFTFTNFLISYRSSRDFQKYQALKLASSSLESNFTAQDPNDSRMSDYLKSFNTVLDEDFQTELQKIAINTTIDEISNQLKQYFAEIAVNSETLLHNSLQASDDIRKELQRLFMMATTIGILFLLLTLSIISRKIILPIRSISKVMQQVKQGDIEARFHSTEKSRDEIILFGQSFDEMLDTLAENNLTLIAYQKELEQKIQELSEREIERQRLTAQLQRIEKMEAIGTLAGGVAHDLNNILSGVVSYPELLLLDLPKDSPYRKTILTIQESGQKAAAIVQDLLTLARRGVAVTEVTNLNSQVKEYLASPVHQKNALAKPDISVEVDLQPNLFNIKGSPVHLGKTIMNLVSNAMESITGEGRVAIYTENRYISVPIAGYDNVKQGDYAVLIIADSGIGIPADDIEKIFEPFFTKKVMGTSGTGLGLAVVWGTVKDHNGYIDVQSVHGEGTTFTLYFPITREGIDLSDHSTPLQSYMGKGQSILVVDDISSQRDIASAMLEKLGYRIQTASSGEEAIQYMRNTPVDVVVLDMLMPPGIDGLETYRRILEFSPNQPAIIASGYSETTRVKEAQKLGAAIYIKKPYILEHIGLAIHDCLKKRKKGQ